MREIKGCRPLLLKNIIFGNFIRIDSSTLCQLKCPCCIQNNGEENVLGKGYLKLKDFKKFVRENPGFKNIEISNYGEIFLSPELKDIVGHAYKAGINLRADNGVNLNTVKKDVLEHLVKYKLKIIRVSIDGATDKTYRIYRIGGDLSRVIENIKIINHYKAKYNSVFPELIWQFVLFGHNEHELAAARRKAHSLNMRFVPIFNWDLNYSPIQNKGQVQRLLGFTSWMEHDDKTDGLYIDACLQFWTGPQINWDGRLLGCCVNHWGDFGNVFKKGLESCLESKEYILTKKALLGMAHVRKGMPCYHCFHYKDLQSKNRHERLYSLLEQHLQNYFQDRITAA